MCVLLKDLPDFSQRMHERRQEWTQAEPLIPTDDGHVDEGGGSGTESLAI